MAEDKSIPTPLPGNQHPQGGKKDTNDLNQIKGIQDQGMQDKAKQVEDLPESVKGTDAPKYPQNR